MEDGDGREREKQGRWGWKDERSYKPQKKSKNMFPEHGQMPKSVLFQM